MCEGKEGNEGARHGRKRGSINLSLSSPALPGSRILAWTKRFCGLVHKLSTFYSLEVFLTSLKGYTYCEGCERAPKRTFSPFSPTLCVSFFLPFPSLLPFLLGTSVAPGRERDGERGRNIRTECCPLSYSYSSCFLKVPSSSYPISLAVPLISRSDDCDVGSRRSRRKKKNME